MKRRACSGARIPPGVPVGFTALGPAGFAPKLAVAMLPRLAAGLRFPSGPVTVAPPIAPDAKEPSPLWAWLSVGDPG